MGQSVFPAAAGGGIKLVQRGQAVSAGNITITAVDTTKAFVTFVSQGAAGTVASNSTVPGLTFAAGQYAALGPSGSTLTPGSYSAAGETPGSWYMALSGGTMDATTKQMGVYLSNSTTLVATGACRWEVVEFA
jgi:hypothetical protein